MSTGIGDDIHPGRNRVKVGHLQVGCLTFSDDGLYHRQVLDKSTMASFRESVALFFHQHYEMVEGAVGLSGEEMYTDYLSNIGFPAGIHPDPIAFERALRVAVTDQKGRPLMRVGLPREKRPEGILRDGRLDVIAASPRRYHFPGVQRKKYIVFLKSKQ